jgi:hypothetical protein
MSEQTYALLKGTDVVNTAVFDEPDYETLNYLCKG